jgi:hypothetical protein
VEHAILDGCEQEEEDKRLHGGYQSLKVRSIVPQKGIRELFCISFSA